MPSSGSRTWRKMAKPDCTPEFKAKIHGIISRLYGIIDGDVIVCRACRQVVFKPVFGDKDHSDDCPVRDLQRLVEG
jgi:hypothetical protein